VGAVLVAFPALPPPPVEHALSTRAVPNAIVAIPRKLR
jgi:hypothetical protein